MKKCDFEGTKLAARTQSGHFRLQLRDVELSHFGSFQPQEESHHQTYDAISKTQSLTRHTEN